MAIDAMPAFMSFDQDVVQPAAIVESLAVALAPAAPTDLKIIWSEDVELPDALSFRFGEAPQPGDTWTLYENGEPIAVDTRFYKGITSDDPVMETTIAAVPFDFSGRESWQLARNPVILPTAYGLRVLTAGNKYEVRVFRGEQSTTGEALYGRFRGATAEGVGDTQTGTVALLDFDYGAAPPAGVSLVRASQGEQVAAVVLDADEVFTFRVGDVGVRNAYTSNLDLKPLNVKLETNRKDVVDVYAAGSSFPNEFNVTINTRALAGKGGIVSLRISNTSPGGELGAPRYLGVVVKDAAGNVPAKPEHLAIGAVNTNEDDAQNFFRGTDPSDPTGFKAFDTQYVYLNDGPMHRPAEPVTPTSPLVYNDRAWRVSSGPLNGKKLIQSLRESVKFGAVPQIVYYNIMTPNESKEIALANLQNRPFMVEYFEDLKFTIDTIRQFANGTTVSLILEPDLLAYMMQSAYDVATQTYRDPSTIAAMTDAAYEAGFLVDPGEGGRLPNTLPGFVEAINRGIRELSTKTVDGITESVNLEYGWKFNLWAYALPAGGSVAKITDVLGWDAGRAVVEKAAATTAAWYTQAGILTGREGATMDFIALDKYGTDGGATGPDYPQNGAGYTDPSKASFLWNADHWNNYLLFAKTLHTSLDGRPVRLWQLPVGHVNGSDFLVGGRKVDDLANIDKQWEDSAATYFFGDAFSGLSRGRIDPAAASAYFASNQANDPLVTRKGDGTIIWGSHMAAARDAGIESMMFGPGLANSTQGGGFTGPALDDFFWAAKAQDYLRNPLPIPRAFTGPGLGATLSATPSREARVADGSIPPGFVTVTRTGDLGRRLVLPVKVLGGTADAGSDYRKVALERRKVVFEPGQASALLVVPTLPTRTAQPEETLVMRIGGARRAQPSIRTRLVLGATPRLVGDPAPPAAEFVYSNSLNDGVKGRFYNRTAEVLRAEVDFFDGNQPLEQSLNPGEYFTFLMGGKGQIGFSSDSADVTKRVFMHDPVNFAPKSIISGKADDGSWIKEGEINHSEGETNRIDRAPFGLAVKREKDGNRGIKGESKVTRGWANFDIYVDSHDAVVTNAFAQMAR